jgi:predicted metal-dependent enzyme (double-stranded beta helix superfamily)
MKGGLVLDIDEFLSDCMSALSETEPRTAVKQLLERTVSDPEGVARALPPERAELVPLHASDEMTVLKVIWAPGMVIPPHNHLMWAAIGLYGGQEDNTFYRRSGAQVQESGGKELRTGEVALLGDDVIHSVANPLSVFTGAIHVYGGNLTARTDRSEWDMETLEEMPADFARTQRYFEEMNAAQSRSSTGT